VQIGWLHFCTRFLHIIYSAHFIANLIKLYVPGYLLHFFLGKYIPICQTKKEMNFFLWQKLSCETSIASLHGGSLTQSLCVAKMKDLENYNSFNYLICEFFWGENWVFATNLNPISSQPNVVDVWYFKLWIRLQRYRNYKILKMGFK